MIVCHCNAVTDRAILEAVRGGARTRGEVASACSASQCCGGCAPAIDELIAAETGANSAARFSTFREFAVVA
jgi:bacterioferritin-associated ferredoxin